MSDTNLGRDFVQHRPTCRCDDCHADRLQSENRKLKARIKELEARLVAAVPDAETLAHHVAVWDFQQNNDYFCWKFGGDGDNGEFLIAALKYATQAAAPEVGE